MKTIIKTIAASAIVVALSMASACNTVKGAGEDVTDVGKGIERAVR